MDIVTLYQQSSTEGFRFDPTRRISTDSVDDLATFLSDFQETAKPQNYRIKVSDVKLVLDTIASNPVDDFDLNVKIVIHKGNTNIKPETIRLGGIWVNLLFIARVVQGSSVNWIVYGGGKGRYRRYPMMEIKEKHPLGFSYHVSINQKDFSRSASFSPVEMIKHRIKPK